MAHNLAAVFRNAENRVVWALRRRLSPAQQFRLLGALDRLGCRPERITAGPAAGMFLMAPFSRRSTYCAARFEPEVTSALERLVRPGDVAFDVGGHLGYFTMMLAKLAAPTGRVYTFEPSRAHAAMMRRSAALNSLENVQVVEQAVGAVTGEAVLDEHAYGALTRASVRVDHLLSTDKGRVPMITLDDWCAEAGEPGRPRLIKIDVEGGERAVLEGAQRLIARTFPHLICELHFRARDGEDPVEVVRWMQAAGYRVEVLRLPEAAPVELEKALAWCRKHAVERGGMVVIHVHGTPPEGFPAA